MQPPSSAPDPYYPPTTGAPASGYPSYPADAPAAGGYGPSAYGAPPQTTSFAAPGAGTPQPGGFGASPPPPSSRKGLIPLIIGIVVALIVVGVGMFTAGYLTGKNRAEAAAATAPAADTTADTAGATPSARPEGVAGKWTGTYTCAQGETGLTLTITGPDSSLKATFEFYPTSGSGEKGSYTMGGSLVDGSLRLIGVEWIDQPAGYGMVNISSTNVTATTITGKVEADGCTEFSVTRA